MNTRKILEVMSIAVIALAVPVLGLFVGGFSITAKTGSAPKGFWWTDAPAIGGGIVGICSLAIMATMVATAEMPRGVKIWIGFLGLLGLSATALNLPLYMIASAKEKGIPDAIQWAFGKDIRIGFWTYISYMLWFVSIDTGLAGVITARMFTESEPRSMDRKEGSQDIELRILEALSKVEQSADMLHDDMDCDISEIRKALKRLEGEGKIEKGSLNRGAYLYRRVLS